VLSGKPEQSHLVRIFPGESELAQTMRSLDWSATELGDPLTWPGHLRGAMSLCLASPIPVVIHWGPRHTLLYNDPFVVLRGDMEPARFLGRPARECWLQVWDTVGPMLERVRETGQASTSQDLRMHLSRNVPREEVHIRFGFGPIVGDDGHTVEGVFCSCTETTDRVIGERRLETLSRLAARGADARDVETACRQAAEVLGDNPDDVPFAAIYVADPSGTKAALRRAARVPSGTAPLPRVIPSDEASLLADLLASALISRQIVQSPLLDELARRIESAGGGEGARALAVPIPGAGGERSGGLFVVGTSPHRAPSRDERLFFSMVAQQIGATLCHSIAYEAERRRAEELQEEGQQKNAFFTRISQELRTPLTLMLSPVEEFLSRAEERIDARDRRLLTLARRNGRRLLKLIDVLRDFSRIEAGRMEAAYVPTDLASMTSGLAGTFRSACQAEGLELIVDCPPLSEPVYVDQDMWEEIVHNLLSNALKFTFEGRIEVSMRADAAHAVLAVRDTGTGIEAVEIPHLFERFHRVKRTRGRTHDGNGIGLALVKELVHLHGGSIEVASTPGQGSIFTVSIPMGVAHLPRERLADRPAGRPPPAMKGAGVEENLPWIPDMGSGAPQGATTTCEPAQQAASGRVLVADDDADLRELICRLLHDRYIVQEAGDGETALAHVRSSPPDLVLADVMMPRLDGIELVRALREDPATRAVPVILLSACADETSRAGGLEAGADDYIVKPFSSRELLARVRAHLELARLRRETDAAIRHNEERLRTTLSAAGAAAWTWNMRTNHVDASPDFTHLFGLADGETNLFAAAMGRIVPEDRDRVLRQLREQAARGEDLSAEFRINHPDRGLRWHAAHGRMVSPDRAMGITTDITARRQAEEALRDADRRKDEFLAMLAHELSNPLAPMRNALHVMRVAQSPEQIVRVRSMMERQVEHMVRLVGDLMEVSRISRGKVHLRKKAIDLIAVLRRAVETARPMIEASRHTLTVSVSDNPLTVDGDAVRLAQVFTNILNNAAKYTDPGGRIRITARQDEAGKAVVSVRDNGQGIAPETLPFVFELFAQADRSLPRAQGGLGIGLTLVRRLVDLHGGTVEASSAGVGKGSEFTVRLPVVAHAQPRPRSQHDQPPARLAGRRVLVVDDNHDAADSLGILLQCLGAEVRVAHDGAAALETLEAFQPSAAVLDLGMPSMDGFELARRIRSRPGGEKMMLIALTGWGQEGTRRRAREAGFDHYLIKPANVQTLRSLLAPEQQPAAG
jgi:PAS domain S-box-containing protein